MGNSVPSSVAPSPLEKIYPQDRDGRIMQTFGAVIDTVSFKTNTTTQTTPISTTMMLQQQWDHYGRFHDNVTKCSDDLKVENDKVIKQLETHRDNIDTLLRQFVTGSSDRDKTRAIIDSISNNLMAIVLCIEQSLKLTTKIEWYDKLIQDTSAHASSYEMKHPPEHNDSLPENLLLEKRKERMSNEYITIYNEIATEYNSQEKSENVLKRLAFIDKMITEKIEMVGNTTQNTSNDTTKEVTILNFE